MFNSIFDTSVSGLSISTALICAGVALVLGVSIAITHMKTSQTTKGFLTTLAVLPLLVMAVMIMINGNLGTSIAILGAFSLIRFRSIQGRAKDGGPCTRHGTRPFCGRHYRYCHYCNYLLYSH